MKKKQAVQKPMSKKTIQTNDNNATLIVKIISIYEYIVAGFGILMGLILLFGGQLLIGLIPLAELPQFLGAFIGAALVVISILLIAFSIFTIFVARALSNHKNWARILLIVCSVAGALTALLSLPSGVVGLLINGAIVYFLGFDKNVIGLFK